MSDSDAKRHPRVRQLDADEQARHRQWPKKKHLASEHPELMPKPGSKSRIHSVITALPVIMLIVGFIVYFKAERAQQAGPLLLDQLVEKSGTYNGTSKSGKSKRFVWIESNDKSVGIRATVEQAALFSEVPKGNALVVQAAPTVQGSNTLWLYSASRNGEWVLEPAVAE